jgi:hypothetical protein
MAAGLLRSWSGLRGGAAHGTPPHTRPPYPSALQSGVGGCTHPAPTPRPALCTCAHDAPRTSPTPSPPPPPGSLVKRAMHGTRMLSWQEIREQYGREVVNLRNEGRWVFLNTLFSVSEAVMFAQVGVLGPLQRPTLGAAAGRCRWPLPLAASCARLVAGEPGRRWPAPPAGPRLPAPAAPALFAARSHTSCPDCICSCRGSQPAGQLGRGWAQRCAPPPIPHPPLCTHDPDARLPLCSWWTGSTGACL